MDLRLRRGRTGFDRCGRERGSAPCREAAISAARRNRL